MVDGLYNVSNRLSPQPGASEGDANSRQYAVYGRFKAGYKDFLFLEATGRNDWVSVLDPAHNSFFYPALSMSFIPQSAFPQLKTIEFINSLKLRAGWSQVGNINIGAYALRPTFGQANGFPYSTGAGFTTGNTLVARDLKPEITNGWELGFDGEFYKNRITAGLTFYTTSTTDQTVAVGISTATGFSSFRTNTGRLLIKVLKPCCMYHPLRMRNGN